MDLQKKFSDKFLLYEDNFKGPINTDIPSSHSCSFLSDRVSINPKYYYSFDDKYWTFTAFDFLMKESSQIQFPKVDNTFIYNNFYSLDGEFGFIVEQRSFQKYWRINFVKMDWNTNEFKLIEHFEKQCKEFSIFSNKSDNLKFVLKWTYNSDTYHYQICQLVKEKIDFGEIFQSTSRFDYFFDSKLISDHKLSGSRITVYDLFLEKEDDLKVDRSSLPEYARLDKIFGWNNDRFYICVRFSIAWSYGIAWADLIQKRWTLLNLKINLGGDNTRWNLNSVNGNLIVSTEKSYKLIENGKYEIKIKVYAIPVKRPNHLRYSAWLLVVKVMKKYGEKDPYKSAKEFLPLNSDLRPIWFKNEEPKKSLKRKLDI